MRYLAVRTAGYTNHLHCCQQTNNNSYCYILCSNHDYIVVCVCVRARARACVRAEQYLDLSPFILHRFDLLPFKKLRHFSIRSHLNFGLMSLAGWELRRCWRAYRTHGAKGGWHRVLSLDVMSSWARSDLLSCVYWPLFDNASLINMSQVSIYIFLHNSNKINKLKETVQKVKVKVKQALYRPGMAQRVAGS